MAKIKQNLKHLKKEYNKWLVRVNIPLNVRHAFDGKREYLKFLDTEDLEIANIFKIPHIDIVETKIKAVQNGTHVNEDLAQTTNFYRTLISETSHGDSKAEAQEQDLNYAVEAIIPGGWATVNKLGGSNPDFYKAIQEAPAGNRAMESLDIANIKKVPTGLHIDDFQKHMDIAERTKPSSAGLLKIFHFFWTLNEEL